jgi:hypothetical protein
MQPEFVFAGCFALAWLAGLTSWILGLLEYRAIRRLTGRFFHIGPVIRRETTNLPRPAVQPGVIHEFLSIQVKAASPDLVIFAPLSTARFGTRAPFALKGQARWDQGHNEITLRAPFSMFSFGLAWLSGATIWVIAAILFMPLGFVLGGLAALAGGTILMLYFRRTARNDCDVVLSEFTGFCGGRSGAMTGVGPSDYV